MNWQEVVPVRQEGCFLRSLLLFFVLLISPLTPLSADPNPIDPGDLAVRLEHVRDDLSKQLSIWSHWSEELDGLQERFSENPTALRALALVKKKAQGIANTIGSIDSMLGVVQSHLRAGELNQADLSGLSDLLDLNFHAVEEYSDADRAFQKAFDGDDDHLLSFLTSLAAAKPDKTDE